MTDGFIGEVTDIGPFYHHDPVIPAKGPVKLPIAHINGIHFFCSEFEQAVGESACGGTDIKTNRILNRYGKTLKRFFKFKAAPADIRMIRGVDLKACIVLHLGAGFVCSYTVYQNLSGHDHGFGPFP